MATYGVVENGKVVETLKAQNSGTTHGPVCFFNEKASTVSKIVGTPGMSVAKRDSKLRPWRDAVRGGAEGAGHSSEALRRRQVAVRAQHQRLIDFARMHPRHLTLVEFREYKLLHGAWLEASRALWQFEHPGEPSPEFKLTRV